MVLTCNGYPLNIVHVEDIGQQFDCGADYAPSRLRNGQPTSPDSISVNNQDTLCQFTLSDAAKHLLQPGYDFDVAPVAAPKQDEAWSRCAGEHEQARIVKVSSHDRSCFFCCPSDDFGIGSATETEF